MKQSQKFTANNVPRELDAAVALMVRCPANTPSLAELARAAGLSITSLNRKFRRQLGLTPRRWFWKFRTQLAAEMLATAPQASCLSISRRCGFASMAHFSRRFHIAFEQPPRAFRAHCLLNCTSIDSHVHPTDIDINELIERTLNLMGKAECPPGTKTPL
jgi:transcriptional regulator GlxA family with amidase domain